MKRNKRKDIVIIDMGVGNLFSIQKACAAVGLPAILSSEASTIEDAGGLILPGVGAFGNAMNALRRLNLISVLAGYRDSGRPVLGICLGMQLLMDYSDEFGRHKGLGYISGSVKSLRHEISGEIPHIGWSPVFNTERGKSWDNTLLHSFDNNDYQYFVHSYFVNPDNIDDTLAITRYSGFSFCAVVHKDNVTGCQFHPERSGGAGLGIYKQWAVHSGLLP